MDMLLGTITRINNILPFTLGALVLLYTLYGAFHRLFLSPIASFPGPKLAAVTWWYQFYYDVYPHYGQYAFHIRDLHRRYGPIVRINPFELHVATPEFFEVLYASSPREKRDKWAWLTETFGMPNSTFATVDHARHRVRRAALSPYFSAASVRRLQPVVDERVRVCLERIRRLRRKEEKGRVEGVAVIASAFTSDVIMTYAFGRSHKRLENPDFGKEIYDAGHEGGLLGPVMMHMKWILWIIQSLPSAVVKSLGPAMAAFVEMRQVIHVLNEKEIIHQDRSHKTIFHELLNSKLPEEDKTVDRLADEALSVVQAGNETVSWALTVATYHILANPRVLWNLKTELAANIPDPDAEIPASRLEGLPYLNAIYKEALRLSYGMSCRLQRVPHEPLPFSAPDRDWVIPAGTPVSMTSILLHHDQTIFPDDQEFQPERWIGNPRLWKYMVSFGAGSRGCLGQSLASSEMHLWLAAVFRRFGSKEVQFEGDEGMIELVDTDIYDVQIAADRIIPAVRQGSKGVRIRVILNE